MVPPCGVGGQGGFTGPQRCVPAAHGGKRLGRWPSELGVSVSQLRAYERAAISGAGVGVGSDGGGAASRGWRLLPRSVSWADPSDCRGGSVDGTGQHRSARAREHLRSGEVRAIEICVATHPGSEWEPAQGVLELTVTAGPKWETFGDAGVAVGRDGRVDYHPGAQPSARRPGRLRDGGLVRAGRAARLTLRAPGHQRGGCGSVRPVKTRNTPGRQHGGDDRRCRPVASLGGG